jgi:phage terminase large subunit-like protein
MVMYEKVGETDRIDVFDASVFGVVRMQDDKSTITKTSSWF